MSSSASSYCVEFVPPAVVVSFPPDTACCIVPTACTTADELSFASFAALLATDVTTPAADTTALFAILAAVV